MSLAALAERCASSPPTSNSHKVALKLSPTSGDSLDVQLTIQEPTTRRRLALSSRSKQTEGGAEVWAQRDMGSGGNQWSNLNVTADRKKKRCADCTRPLEESCATLLCSRCTANHAPAAAESKQVDIAAAAEPSASKLTSHGASEPSGELAPQEDATRRSGVQSNADVAKDGEAEVLLSWVERLENPLLHVGVGVAVGACVLLALASTLLKLAPTLPTRRPR